MSFEIIINGKPISDYASNSGSIVDNQRIDETPEEREYETTCNLDTWY